MRKAEKIAAELAARRTVSPLSRAVVDQVHERLAQIAVLTEQVKQLLKTLVV